ncbi:MAG: hypothetical protein COY50_02785 [Deltaproteobacteria bacterium CG_4_10_14_0_8_um_filter_43_12]|nr:MAG: hypothetical protein COY50_02785 [Deltaproteobacteria bacterium CG_4_10_14_0_8_um_filter_43_12]
MKGKILRNLMKFCLVGILLMALIVYAVSAEAKPPIRHYYIIDLTGPYGILVPEIFEGTQDYYRYINEKGGLDGHQFKIPWGETGNMMGRTWSHYKRFKQAGCQFLALFSSPDGEALKKTLERDGIACYNIGQSDPQIYPPGNIFLDGCSYADGFGAFLKWVKKDWEKKGKSGIPRVGIIGPDAAYGRAATKPGIRFGKQIGVDVVGQEFAPVVPIDLTAQILRLRDKGVDWIWLQGLSQIGTVFIKNFNALGLRGKIGVAAFWWTMGTEMLRRVPPDMLEGYIFNTYTYMEVDDRPGIKKLNELRMKYRGKKLVEGYIRGFHFAEVVMGATRLAYKAKGYKGLTGDNYIKYGFERMKNYRGEFDLGAPVTIKPNDRRTSNAIRLYQVKGGKVLGLSDWIEVPHLYPPEMGKYFEK